MVQVGAGGCVGKFELCLWRGYMFIISYNDETIFPVIYVIIRRILFDRRTRDYENCQKYTTLG
jgi:hypothetical protein